MQVIDSGVTPRVYLVPNSILDRGKYLLWIFIGHMVVIGYPAHGNMAASIDRVHVTVQRLFNDLVCAQSVGLSISKAFILSYQSGLYCTNHFLEDIEKLFSRQRGIVNIMMRISTSFWLILSFILFNIDLDVINVIVDYAIEEQGSLSMSVDF